MNNAGITIADKMYALFGAGPIGVIMTCREIIDRVVAAYQSTNRSSVIPSDYCYNIVNAGIKFEHHLFEYLGAGKYRALGKNYPYVGPILWKGRKVGEWRPGAGPILYERIPSVTGSHRR